MQWQATGVAAALENEKAMRSLTAATFRFGEAAPGVTAGLSAQSAQLAAFSTQARNAITQAQALAASMVRIPSQIGPVVETAVRLTEAFGGDLQTNTRNLAATLEGNLALSLRLLVPELGTLSESALKSGEAIELLATRIPAATTSLSRYAEALERTKRAQEANAEAAGEAVTQSEEIIRLQERLANATERGVENGTSLAEVWERFTLSLKLGAKEFANSASNLFSWTTNAELAARRAEEFTKAVEDAALAQKAFNDQLLAADQLENRIASQRDSVADRLSAAGITLRDLAAEERELAETERQLLELIRTATDEELPSYNLALAQVRVKIAEINGETAVGASAVGEFTARQTEGAEAAATYAAALDLSARSARQAAAAYGSATSAVIGFGRAARQVSIETGVGPNGAFRIVRDANTGRVVTFSVGPVAVQGTGGAPQRANTVGN